jgi:voltage-gated potassium channel
MCNWQFLPKPLNFQPDYAVTKEGDKVPRARLLIPVKRANRGWRLMRATWRNIQALWGEFRVPLIVFLVAIFGGGWLYGELWIHAGYDRKPLVDLPYLMAALMIVNSPDDLPKEPELVAFWYLMPLIGAYVAARGVTDFFNLFLKPSEHRNAWEEAVASTYHNHVIILGVGHLGTRVVRALVAMGFEVVAIDRSTDPEKTAELERRGVPLVVGDGRLASTLETAGIRKAQALIVCTSNDHMNLEVTMRARDLNPHIRIVVRMWEDRFAEQIQRFMNVEAVLSATDLAAPSFAAYALGIEITQTFNIGSEDYSMVRLEVTPGSFLDGKTIGLLQDSENLDIVLHSRDGDPQVHPADDVIVQPGDTLVIFAQHRTITDVVSRNQRRRLVTSE